MRDERIPIGIARKIGITLCAATLCSAVSHATAQPAERVRFVSEYVRELIALESLRDTAEAELKQQKTENERMADCIRNSEAFQLELHADAGILKGLHLDGDLREFPGQFADFYQQKAMLYQQMSDGCAAFMSPKPNADYSALAAEFPKITAGLDYIDRALFDVSPAVFAALIDPKPDAQNHLSRLIITRRERDGLVQRINSGFGRKLDANNQNWTVSAASELRDYLIKKGYKLADDP